ncbi:MAG: Dynamin family protein [Bacteroidetes bacterium]|nr:Dynamin family protein [Bacteroidota bacterium]
MKTFNELKNNILGLFDDTAKFATNNGYKGTTENLLKVKNDFQKKELMVVVCGEMKRGKSSLLTAFLEEENIFPIDVNTCTNVVTVVRYGKTEKIEVFFEKRESNGDIKYESSLIRREEIEKYVTEYGNEQNKKHVNCIVVEIPNKKLKEGFVFVDTPGVGSLNFAHAQVTYGFLPNADVMLFVSDVLNPLTDSELKFFEKAYGFCKNIIFPLTKSDKKTSEEIQSTINNNIQKIKTITQFKEDDIHIIPVSSKMKIKFLENQKEDYLTNSNYPKLEKLIWQTIYDNRCKILILPFIKQLLEEIQSLKSNINVQIEALNQDKEIVVKLTKEFQERSLQRKTLLDGNAKWKSEMQYELSNIMIEVNQEIHSESISISEIMNSRLSQKGAAEQLDIIVSEINDLLSNVVFNSRDSISNRTLEIANNVSSELGLLIDVNAEALNKVGFSQEQKIGYNKNQRSYPDKIIDKGRQIGMKSMGGAAMGGVIGAIAGGLLGLFAGPAGIIAGAQLGASWGAGIGAVGGTTIGTIGVVMHSKDEDIPAIRISLSNYISRSINSIQSGINLCIRELTKGLTDELSNQISNQIQQIETTTAQIKQNLTLKQTEIPKHASKLNSQISMIDGLGASVEKVMSEITPLI